MVLSFSADRVTSDLTARRETGGRCGATFDANEEEVLEADELEDEELEEDVVEEEEDEEDRRRVGGGVGTADFLESISSFLLTTSCFTSTLSRLRSLTRCLSPSFSRDFLLPPDLVGRDARLLPFFAAKPSSTGSAGVTGVDADEPLLPLFFLLSGRDLLTVASTADLLTDDSFFSCFVVFLAAGSVEAPVGTATAMEEAEGGRC